MKEKLRNKSWYPYTVTACSAVTLYVLLTNLKPVMKGIRTFLGYFSAIFLACVLAYLMNPMARLYQGTLFKKLRSRKAGWLLSVGLTIVTLLLFILFLLGTLIPQLVDSITTLLGSMDGHLAALKKLTDQGGMAEIIKVDELLGTSGSLMNQLFSILKNNLSNILNVSVAAGRRLAGLVIALIVSVYLLAAKDSVKSGTARLMKALLPEKRYERTAAFVGRCDRILSRYIVFSLLDAILVGIGNAIFMSLMGMQYVGLISLVAALTNLVPTFGPIIGYVIGGFVLLLVNPVHAAIFVAFSLVLQFFDGYIIKPKLFGSSLGVSGLLILAAVIVCGNMFGIVGMLLAIPLAAILDFVYKEEFLPAMEAKRLKSAAESAAASAAASPADRSAGSAAESRAELQEKEDGGRS